MKTLEHTKYFLALPEVSPFVPVRMEAFRTLLEVKRGRDVAITVPVYHNVSLDEAREVRAALDAVIARAEEIIQVNTAKEAGTPDLPVSEKGNS